MKARTKAGGRRSTITQVHSIVYNRHPVKWKAQILEKSAQRSLHGDTVAKTSFKRERESEQERAIDDDAAAIIEWPTMPKSVFLCVIQF